jgi:dCMP deaminase
MRLEREEYFKEVARLTARRSTCLRRQVGCVIVGDNHIISLGYNGAPPGEPHCTPETCNETMPCLHTIHAEANAIKHAPGYYVPGSILYSTDEPCVHCARKLIIYGVVEVYYDREYRNHEGLQEFAAHNIPVHRF